MAVPQAPSPRMAKVVCIRSPVVLALEGRRNKAQGERTREPWERDDGSAPRVREYAHPGLYYDALPGLRVPSNREHAAALLASAFGHVTLKLLDHRLDLFAKVHRHEFGVVQLRLAAGAVPTQMMRLREGFRLFDDEADGVRWPARRVRHLARQQKDFALLDRNIAKLAVVDDLQHDVAFDLIKQLFAGIDVIIG